MAFGLFIQNYVPNHRREHDPEAEHHAIFEELEAVVAADKAGFKYVWVTEHHFLDEYSHLSANDVVAGYLAHATERIHIGSGIFNPLPQVNHPAKVAERVAMLDHLSEGRFEFGTGRGAGSHEILAFLPGMTDLSGTRDIWEDVNGEPIGAFVNDNIMVTTAATVAEDVEDAIQSIATQRMTYLQSNVFRYHDTFPHPPEIPKWPDLIPDVTEEGARQMIGAPGSVNGTPDDALKGAMAWEAAGADQLVFGFGPPTLEESLRTIELLGKYVIPKLDKDPVHRTDRFKEAAAAAAAS